MATEYLIALAGNPNSGKTTLFNAITGARQHVGNYPGVTVEKKEGYHQVNGHSLHLVDLPGAYSLTAYSLDERVARQFLVNDRPRLVIDIIDASNLERNLYLTVQFLELGVPLVIALNMVDEARAGGVQINVEELARRLQLPVIPTVARNETGTGELVQAALERCTVEAQWAPLRLSYGQDVDEALDRMERLIEEARFLTDLYPPRWLALKYLEHDEDVIQTGAKQNLELSLKLIKQADRLSDHLKKTLKTTPEAVIADHRYGFIRALLRDGVVQRDETSQRLQLTTKLDQLFTNRFFGPLIMFAILYGMYAFTFSLGGLPVDWLKAAISTLGKWAESVLPAGLFQSLIVSGVIDGVGGVIGFVPIILFMFLGITFLDDTGYLARAAYMLDRVFRLFGLHGSSFMAFIVSGGIAGGCAVPGVMASRTLRSSRERMATILTVPFMNCGAKLPVFALLVAAFFPDGQAWMMLLITVLSWGGALLAAKLLRSTLFKGPATPFLLELPPYRLPTFRGLLIHTWERTWLYIRKAGTVILAISIILWAMMTFPELPEESRQHFELQRESLLAETPEDLKALAEAAPLEGEPEAVGELRQQLREVNAQEAQETLRFSLAGRMGMALEPLGSLCGFDWRANVALVGGFAAKEVIVSTLGTAFSLGEVDPEENTSLSEHLAADPRWNPLVALSLIVFTVFYAPCFVTVVCIVKEAGNWKWGLFSLVFNTILAFGAATAVYQIGSLLGFGVKAL